MKEYVKWTECFKIFVSNPIKVDEFRHMWLEVFPDFSGQNESDSSSSMLLSKKMRLPPIPADLEGELLDVCSENALTCANESQNYEYTIKRLSTTNEPVFHNVPKDVNLVTLRLQHEEITKRWNNSTYLKKVNTARKRRYDYEIPLQYLRKKSDDVIVDMVDPTDVMLTVTVCEPSNSYVKKCLRDGGLQYRVLGSQKLTELRDKINCISDLMVTGDFSQNPDAPRETKAKDLYKSGFFFINNTFYNDMRDLNNRDYSKVIIDWANADPARKLGPFTKRNMEDTTFMELEIQLGYPYLYTHQGNCEHLLIFNDLSMVNADGCMDRNKYPLHTAIKRTRSKKCMLCHIMKPRWITRNNDRLHLDPFFFCDGCFRNFNYNSAGEKIGDFIAHPYMDRTALI